MDRSLEPDRELRIGEDFELVLEGRGGAGYRWSYTIDNPHVVGVEALLETKAPAAPGSPNGERFVISGLAEGTAIVTFVLVRPFGPKKTPLATRSVGLKVQGRIV